MFRTNFFVKGRFEFFLVVERVIFRLYLKEVKKFEFITLLDFVELCLKWY